MGVTKGKFGVLYKWNGTGSDLAAEACTVNGSDAQITDPTKRILNPNSADLAFTRANTVNLLSIDYASGTAHFDGAPGITTCAGTGACVLAANLVKTAQIFEWSMDVSLDVEDISDFGDSWKAFAGTLGSAKGKIQGFMADSNFWDDFEDNLDGTKDYWFMQLFTYDPDDDETGDHYNAWAIFDGFGVGVNVGTIIKETIGFTVLGLPYFIANA